MNSMFETCYFKATVVNVPSKEMNCLVSPTHTNKKREKKNRRIDADPRPSTPNQAPSPSPIPNTSQPCPGHDRLRGPEGLPCSQCLSSLVHIRCFCQRLLRSLQGREELKCVSDCRSGQFRVSFIKAAIRPIIYHHVFFTAMSQAAIIEGNRFIPWAQRQDIDGWWKLQASM